MLVKKASGFYYNETQLEYQKTQNNSKNNKNYDNFNENINFFEIIDRGDNTLENSCDIIKSVKNKCDESSSNSFDIVKKKVTTHFIPPDLQAIKMLLEIMENNDKSKSIESYSDDELITLRNKLLKELNDEINPNIKDNKM